MEIWKYQTDIENYATIDFVNRTDSKLFLYNFKGQPLPKPWPSISVYFDQEWEDTSLTKAQRKFASRYKGLPKGDFPSLPGSVPVFSEKAVQVLGPLITNSVEIIPLSCEQEKLYLINVIDVVDCFDREQSVLKSLPSGGFMEVLHYKFKNVGLLERRGMVKFTGLPVDIFVTDAFKALVEKHELQGLLWKPLP